MDLKEKTNINIQNTVPNALFGPSACPGKSALKTALQCILDSTAVYLDFHCSENGNGWLGGLFKFFALYLC